MIIVYAPAGGEPEQYDARSLRVSEAGIVSRTTDMKWADIQTGLQSDDLEAMRGIVWVLKKRGEPSLRYGDFDPGIEELYTRLDHDEVRSTIEAALTVAALNPGATAEDVRTALADLPHIAADREHAERLIEEMAADPKDAPAPSPAASSGSPSETPTSSLSAPSTSDSSGTSSTSRRRRSTT